MSKISVLDRAALKALREPIEAELKALGERLGIAFQVGSGSFGEGAEASFKLILTVNDPAAKLEAARKIWNANCRYIGLDFASPDSTGLRPEDFGTEFAYGDAIMRTTGIATKGRNCGKFPILVEIVKPGSKGGEIGETRMLPETAAARIREATDKARVAA